MSKTTLTQPLRIYDISVNVQAANPATADQIVNGIEDYIRSLQHDDMPSAPSPDPDHFWTYPDAGTVVEVRIVHSSRRAEDRAARPAQYAPIGGDR